MFLAAALAPVILVSTRSYFENKQQITRNIGATLETTATQIAAQIDQTLFFRREEVKNWALFEVMEDVMANDVDLRITTTLIRLKNDSGVHAELFCISPDGIIRASSNISFIDKSVANDTWFQALDPTAGAVVGDYAYDDMISDYTISISTPIHTRDAATADVIGYLSVRLKKDEFRRIIDAAEVATDAVSTGRHALLSNGSGAGIYGSPAIIEMTGSRLIRDHDPHTSHVRPADVLVLPSASQGNSIETAATGEQIFVGYARSTGYRDYDGNDWYVLIAEKFDSAVAPVHALRRNLLKLFVGVFLSVSALAVIISSRVSRPIRQLTRLTHQIAEGDFSRITVVHSNDEIGDLADTINMMSAKLDRSLTALEEGKHRAEQAEGRAQTALIESERRRMAEIAEQDAKLALIRSERRREIAEQANEAKSEFLANMSHELRTPLHGILSFSNFGIRRHQTVDRTKLLQYFETIHTCGHTLLALLDDLLDLAKLESGKMTYDLAEHDFGRLIMSIGEEFRSRVEDRQINLSYHWNAERTVATVDAERIKQVMRNLLGNAVKFVTDSGKITVTLTSETEYLRIDVEDNGIGIPEDETEKIFEKFMQSSKTNTGAGGTGLGLSICAEIIAAHNGRIHAANRPDGGACFTVQIPYNPVTDAAALTACDT